MEDDKKITDAKVEVIPSQLFPVIEHLLRTFKADGTPKRSVVPMIWAGFGVGKTSMVRQFARKYGLRVCALHLPQYAPTDLKGFPIKTEDGRVLWVASSYLPQQHRAEGLASGKSHAIEYKFYYATGILVRILDESQLVENLQTGEMEPKEVARFNDIFGKDYNDIKTDLKVVRLKSDILIDLTHAPKGTYTVIIEDKAALFLDEISAADEDTAKAALQLVLDRRVADYDVPSSTPIIGAGNHEKHGAHIGKMSAPLATRMCHVRLIPSVSDFVMYGLRKNLRPVVLNYIREGALDTLWHYNPATMKEGDMGQKSPRTWEMLSDQIDDDMDRKILEVTAAGFVGSATSIDFLTYFDMHEKLPNCVDILEGRLLALAPEHKEIGIQHRVAFVLAREIKRFYDRFYEEGKPFDQQPQEWKDAVVNYCTFCLDGGMKSDVTMMTAHYISKAFEIEATAMLDRNSPKSSEWVMKFLPIQRMVKQGSAKR